MNMLFRLVAVSAFASCSVANAALPQSAAFVPNGGQWDSRAAFAVRTFAGTAFVTRDGAIVYRSGSVLTEAFVDPAGRPIRVLPGGANALAGKVSYAIGSDPARHRDGLARFGRIELGEVYEGVEVCLDTTGGTIEKVFTIAPNGDPDIIRAGITGASALELGPSGELIAATASGPMRFSAPIAYQQDDDGHRTPVAVRYTVDGAALQYGFSVGPYDKTRPLVIDPLLQSTYTGGSDSEVVTGIAVHPATGEIYAVGYTISTDFPDTAGSEQPAHAPDAGKADVFVARFNASLTTRLQTTYIGGSDEDFGLAIAISPSTGDVYVTGNTFSIDFPDAVNSEQPSRSVAPDAFVTRLNAALTNRIQSTYLGGDGYDEARALVVHPVSGDVYVAGYTESSNFPNAAGSEQPTKAATADGFVTRLPASLLSRTQSTYFGGNGNDAALGIAIHPGNGDVYIAGYTNSTDLPRVTGAEQTTVGGDFDGFVARMSPALTTRGQATYVGGSLEDLVRALAIHPVSGEVFIAGSTTSANLPKIGGSEQGSIGAGHDAFVTRLNEALTTRLQSTFIGGSGDDFANALVIHPVTGDVYVTGTTGSADFPNVAAGDQPSRNIPSDAFVTRLDPSLTIRVQSTYLGGDSTDDAFALAVHPTTSEIYVAGSTQSTNLLHTTGSEQPNKSGGFDGYLSRFSFDLRGGDAVPDAFAFAPRTNVAAGSQQTSDPVQITGIAGDVPISVVGGGAAQYCISAAANCNCDVRAMGSARGTIANGQFVCARQTAPAATPDVAKAVVIVGGGFGTFQVSTGAVGGGQCTFDLDANNVIDALTDGLILIRAMFGLTGAAATANAIGPGAQRTTWTQIQQYLNTNCGTNFAP